MIHLYCGDGKGKTSAAIGLTIRAAGNNKKVLFAQFMKSEPSGELNILEKIDNVTVMRAQTSSLFTYQMKKAQKEIAASENNHLFQQIRSLIIGNNPDNTNNSVTENFDVIVLDEIVTAVEHQFIAQNDLKSLLSNCITSEQNMPEMILTGSTPEQWMIEMSDYVTDMEKIKHPFDKGQPARKGIEY